MGIYLETTEISVERTVGEIQGLLGRAGCVGVIVMYDDNKEVAAVGFEILLLDRRIPFRLPCRWEAVRNVLYKQRKNGTHSESTIKSLEVRAKRIAWRQILYWVKAQLALIDTDMVKVQEIFLPFVQTSVGGETLFQKLEGGGFKSIGYQKE